MGLRKGEGGYIRIQNLSSSEVEIKMVEGRNVDELGMDNIVGTIAPGEQLPTGGKECFEGSGLYQYIEGDVKNRFQKDGFFHLEAHPSDGSPCSKLTLVVDRTSWEAKDDSEDIESSVYLVADVDEEEDTWKIEIRVFDNYNPKKWMEEYGEKYGLGDKALCQIGMPGTHDSGTYTFDKDKGASPESGLTKVEDILGTGRLLGKVTDMILKNIFKRLCQCQSKSIKEQLEAGVRYIDLRVAYHAESDSYMTCHGVYCVDMNDILQEVNDFLSENSKEIVVLEFKKLYEMEDEHCQALGQKIVDVLGDKVADRNNISPQSTVQDYWDNGYQAVVLYKKRDSVPDLKNKLWSLHSIDSRWPNTGDTEELHDKLNECIEGRSDDKFFVVQGILTPDADLIKNEIMEGDGLSIKKISDNCRCKIVDWMEDEWKAKQNLNIVIVDFFENTNILPAVINYNRS